MTILAASSGIVVYEDGNKLYISKKPAQWTAVILFVAGLLALILLVNGVLQLTVLKDELTGSSKIGIVLIGAGIFFTLVSLTVRLYQKKVNAVPLHDLKKIVIFDFDSNNVLDGQQHILTPVSQAFLTRKMQISSSSPELVLGWATGSVSIVKGNPFSGGIAGIEKVLVAKGIRRK